jgi:hypothetical protein
MHAKWKATTVARVTFYRLVHLGKLVVWSGLMARIAPSLEKNASFLGAKLVALSHVTMNVSTLVTKSAADNSY